jgi:hypothetical protein
MEVQTAPAFSSKKLGHISSVLNHARVVGMTVIQVQVGFRPGLVIAEQPSGGKAK